MYEKVFLCDEKRKGIYIFKMYVQICHVMNLSANLVT